ncbi:hypothetical protein AeRB84_003508 [Aphanomyces euteiches]|nr:hypothetical protein AeRB84_003508 [Aphanomyces euteiches]
MVKNTKNQDNASLTRAAIRKREVKAAETDEQCEARKAKDRERKARKRADKLQADEAGASGRKRPAEFVNENLRVVIPRLNDVVEELTDQLENTHLPPIDFHVQSNVRCERNAIRMRLARANETTEASDHRRELDAQRRAGTRSQETIDEANQRRALNALQTATARSLQISEENRNRRNAEEVQSTADMTPEEIRLEKVSKLFKKYIRLYNSAFQMTSFGADKVDRLGPFMPTFRIQGQVYHRMGSLIPQEGQQPKYLQIYFTDNKDEEIAHRMRALRLKPEHLEIIELLRDMLHENNHLVREFKSKFNALQPSHRLIIRADKTPEGEHERRYNAPTTSEVGILMAGQSGTSRDIVIEQHDGQLRRINELHQGYDSLQYPLIFWEGRNSYHIHIPQMDPLTGLPTTRTVTCKEFYAYHLIVREGQTNPLHYYRDLFNQFLTDMYAKVETQRLNFIRFSQSTIRAEEYGQLRDAVRGERLDPNQVGTRVILPSSFIGSPRQMQQDAQDGMAYVRKFGRPCLFLTFTCNPKWPEITEHIDGLNAFERNDVIARVYELKLKNFMKVTSVLFGPTQACLVSVEWQKRGLPHAHILLWLKEKIRPDQIDHIISAEISDPELEPDLYKTVTTQMIHGPCGADNPLAPCMKNGKCSNRFPKDFISETRTDVNGYPLYRRRSPREGGQTFEKRINRETTITVDNRHVVPYCPILCKMFDAHINVEYCHSVKAIKYICKYIYKGSDNAVFQITSTSNNASNAASTSNNASNAASTSNNASNAASTSNNASNAASTSNNASNAAITSNNASNAASTSNNASNDEIAQFQVGRYINSSEAAW